MLGKFSVLMRQRQGAFIFLSLFCVLAICVIFIGLDNIAGIVLSYLATTVLFFMVMRRWRKIKSFLILFGVSLFCMFFLAFLHEEVIYPLAVLIGGAGVLQSNVLNVIHVTISLLIAIACPVGMFIGIVGTAALGIARAVSLRSRKIAAITT